MSEELETILDRLSRLETLSDVCNPDVPAIAVSTASLIERGMISKKIDIKTATELMDRLNIQTIAFGNVCTCRRV